MGVNVGGFLVEGRNRLIDGGASPQFRIHNGIVASNYWLSTIHLTPKENDSLKLSPCAQCKLSMSTQSRQRNYWKYC